MIIWKVLAKYYDSSIQVTNCQFLTFNFKKFKNNVELSKRSPLCVIEHCKTKIHN